MKSYLSDNQRSGSINDDVKLLLLILDKKTGSYFNFDLDFAVETLLKKIQNISEETVKQTLEKKLLDLIDKKMNKINHISRIFNQTDFNRLSIDRKKFYKTLWEKKKIHFNKITFLSILSILEDKQLDSYKDIYDKLNTKEAKNCIIRNLHTTERVFLEENKDSQDKSDILYLTSNISSFKSIMEAYKNHEYTKISFKLFNPHILWEELTNIESDISRDNYKEIFNTLDKDFITKQLNNSSISLKDFEKLLKKYSSHFLNKIKIEALESDDIKSKFQIHQKTLKSKSKNRDNKRKKLKTYINQHSKIDEIDENVINKYSIEDLVSIKNSINNKELYIAILNKRSSTVKLSSSNNNKIEKAINELSS